MANISISLKKYKADYSRFLHNAKVLRLTFQTPVQRNDNPTLACAESSSPEKLLPAAYCRHRVLYLKVPYVEGVDVFVLAVIYKLEPHSPSKIFEVCKELFS